MPRTSLPLLPCLLLLLPAAAAVAAQDDASFRPLFGDGSLENWSFEDTEQENFSLRDGVLTVRGEGGWLRSPEQYGDFVLRLDFRFLEPDSDSGVFLRAGTGTPFILGWPGDSYQVQIREISVNTSDSPLPLVNLYRHRIADGTTRYERDRVFDLYRGVGEWHDLEIRAQGGEIRVRLDGEEVTVAENIVNPEGYIGFQSEAGVIEYRDVRISTDAP